MQSVRTDFNGKRLNFEAAVKFLKEFLPKTTDLARQIKALDVEGMPSAGDEEGQSLNREERRAQCEKVPWNVWDTYSDAKQTRIRADRDYFGITTGGGKKNGKKKGGGGRRGGRGGGRGTPGGGRDGPNPGRGGGGRKRQIKELRSHMTEMQAQIAALKKSSERGGGGDDAKDDDDDMDPADSIRGGKKAKN